MDVTRAALCVAAGLGLGALMGAWGGNLMVGVVGGLVGGLLLAATWGRGS